MDVFELRDGNSAIMSVSHICFRFSAKTRTHKKINSTQHFFQIGFNLKPILKLLRSIKNWVSPTPVSMAYWFVVFFGGGFPVRELGNWSKSARQPKKNTFTLEANQTIWTNLLQK